MLLKRAHSWSRIVIVICRAWFGRCFWQLCFLASGSGGLECARPVLGGFLIGIPLLVLFGLGTLTWRQTEIWHDTERLWNHALAVHPSSTAHFHVARFIADRGDLAGAEKHLRRAAEMSPKKDVVQSFLAMVLAKQGNLVEATQRFHRALQINPKDPATLNNMGIALAQQGKLDEAIEHFQRSLEIKPNDAAGHMNLANVWLDRGNMEESLKHMRLAVEIDPADADNQKNLATVLGKLGSLAEATHYLRRVVELKLETPRRRTTLRSHLRNRGDSMKPRNFSKPRCASIPIWPKPMRGWGACSRCRRNRKRRRAIIRRPSGSSRRKKRAKLPPTGNELAVIDKPLSITTDQRIT